MGRPKKTKQAAGQLDIEQEFELLFGHDPEKPAFKTDAERRAAWLFHRDELMSSVNVGTRPSGWWYYESREGRDMNGPGALVELVECGEMRQDEAEHLRRLGRELSKDYWPDAAEAAWVARQAKEARNA